MKEYTVKQMKLLAANPYTFKVTKHKLFFTIEFKETFWTSYIIIKSDINGSFANYRQMNIMNI